MQAEPRIGIKTLRVAILVLFTLSVAVTVWSMLSAHNHMLHMTHIALVTTTFLLIALYLAASAKIASLRVYRELRQRIAVDPDVGFAAYLPSGAPVLNVCVGTLAKYGIFVRYADDMVSLAKSQTVAAEGNAPGREGYAATKETLEKMGLTLSDETGDCLVRIVLGPFVPTDGDLAGFVLTRDRIAYLLAAVYISRLYLRYTRLSRALLACAVVVAVVLAVTGRFTYAGAALALWSASEVMIVRRIETLTTRLTFASVIDSLSRI